LHVAANHGIYTDILKKRIIAGTGSGGRSRKMEDKIYEIYTDDSGAFTVGKVVARNNDDIVFMGIDEEGKSSAYYAMPLKTVKEMISDTPYLQKIRKYMQYAAGHPYSGWFTLPELAPDPEKPVLSQVLRTAEREDALVTVCRIGEDELLCGYVRGIEKGRVLLDCVDPETAEDLPQVKLRIKDLEYVEFGSIANMLLRFANRN